MPTVEIDAIDDCRSIHLGKDGDITVRMLDGNWFGIPRYQSARIMIAGLAGAPTAENFDATFEYLVSLPELRT